MAKPKKDLLEDIDEIEQQEEIKESKEKIQSYCVRWFNSHAVENTDEIRIISDLTAKSAEEQFCMYLNNSGNTEVYAVIFYSTFISILEFIKEKQSKYNNYTIQVANSINIGFTNNSDDNNEKVGNFMPIMEYIGINMNYIPNINDTSSDRTSASCIGWKNLNVKHNAECYKQIQEMAYNKLKTDFKVDIRISEAIIPLFCIFMDNINNVVKLKFQEAEGLKSEIHINILGLFDVYYSFNEEDNIEVREYCPGISMKLALKSDITADRD